MPEMYSVLLPLLLLGIWPVANVPQADAHLIASLTVPPPVSPLLVPEQLSASGVLVVDADSGQPLLATQSNYRRPMASLTKLMTALLIVENHAMDEIVTVPSNVSEVTGTQIDLKIGDQFTVDEMLTALLLPSANDAAISLALFHSGSVDDFVALMNARADQLGLQDTRFDNPTGMDSSDQYSTPKDLAWLARYVLREPEIATRMAQAGGRITGSLGTDFTLSHTHDLMHVANSGVVAGKTGTSPAAGECLISIIENGDHRYVAVLLNSSQRYEDLRAVIRALRVTD